MAVELKNTVETVVEDLLAELLKSQHGICKCEKCMLDMKAFALNRLPSRYVVSERGLIHAEMDSFSDPQFNADVINVIFQAIETVTSKLRPGYNHQQSNAEIFSSLENSTTDFFFNFQHILGFVYINEKLDFAENIRISLIDHKTNTLVDMAETGWANPYITQTTTMGLYSFWPKPICSQKRVSTSEFFEFRLVFEKDGYKSEEKDYQFKIVSEQKIFNHIRKDQVHRLPPVILTQNE